MLSTLLALSLAASSASATPARKVYVGLYLADVSALEVKQGRFSADMEVWLKWRGDATPPPVTFVNGEIQSKEELSTESDGDWRSVRWRVQGAFRGTFPLHDYPFDAQKIGIEVSLPEEHGDLVPDLAGSGMAEQFSITGWVYEPFFKAESRHHKVSSDFGSIAAEGEPRKQSELAFVLEMSRPRTAYALKFLVPLGVILAMALLALILPGDQVEVRGGIGVTALLSCVAFQFAAAEDIPNVSYLVVADKLFLAAYVLNLSALVQTVIAFMLWEKRARLSRRLDFAAFALISLAAIITSSNIVGRTARGPAATQAQLAQTPPSAHPTTRKVLRVGVVDLPTLTSQGLPNLLRRGLTVVDQDGAPKAWLVTTIPAMTNEWVRFLPGTGMSIRWQLKPGLQFSDGSALTAHDVVASVARYENVTRTRNEALSDTDYVIEYNDRAPSNLNTHLVFPAEVVEPFIGLDGGVRLFTEQQRTKQPPGDGPYVVSSFEPDKQAVLTVNPHFSGRTPAFERVEFVVLETSENLAQALVDRRIDVAPRVNPEALTKIAATHPEVLVWQYGGEDVSVLIPDLRQALYRDPKVRQALVLALDRQVLANFLDGSDGGTVAHSFRLPTAPDHNPNVQHWPHDPAAAKALLVDGGYPLPLEVKLVDREQKAGKPLAYQQLLQSQLEAAGFKVKWDLYKGAMPATVANEDHGGLRIATRGTTSLRRLFNRRPLGGGWDQRPDGVSDEKIIKDLERSVLTLFDERREVISRRLQLEFAERLPIIPISFVTSRGARVDDLQGVRPPKGDTTVFWNVEDWFTGGAATP